MVEFKLVRMVAVLLDLQEATATVIEANVIGSNVQTHGVVRLDGSKHGFQVAVLEILEEILANLSFFVCLHVATFLFTFGCSGSEDVVLQNIPSFPYDENDRHSLIYGHIREPHASGLPATLYSEWQDSFANLGRTLFL